MDLSEMGAGHFIYIPAVLLIGIVIGWILGSRAAADAYAADLRRREERARREAARRDQGASIPQGEGFA
jgi:hypothetical protein